MSTLATQYYLKAKDNYPYDLPEAMESLEYAMSYNNEHAGTHCLMGTFYYEQLNDFKEAFYHFEQAMIHDVEHIDTYYFFSMALIEYGEFDKAKTLLKHAETIKGICLSCVFERKALIHEKMGNLKKSEKQLLKAVSMSTSNCEIGNLNLDLERVRKKIKKD